MWLETSTKSTVVPSRFSSARSTVTETHNSELTMPLSPYQTGGRTDKVPLKTAVPSQTSRVSTGMTESLFYGPVRLSIARTNPGSDRSFLRPAVALLVWGRTGTSSLSSLSVKLSVPYHGLDEPPPFTKRNLRTIIWSKVRIATRPKNKTLKV